MQGISPKLPLFKNDIDGFYNLNKTLKETVRQNLKNLLLTNPGERIMDPTFGVGLYSFLFENMLPSTYEDIKARVANQVEKYLPFVQIIDISFFESGEGTHELNTLSVKIIFNIAPLQETDVLVINSDLN